MNVHKNAFFYLSNINNRGNFENWVQHIRKLDQIFLITLI